MDGLTKPQQAVIRGLRDGFVIKRYKAGSNSRWSAYRLNYDKIVLPVTMNAIGHMLDCKVGFALDGRTSEEVYTLKAEYQEGTNNA